MSVWESMMQSSLDSLLRNKQLKNVLFWLLGQRCSILAGSFGSDVAAPHAVCPATDAQPEDGARIPQLAFVFGSQ
jgi:hypothetical protein